MYNLNIYDRNKFTAFIRASLGAEELQTFSANDYFKLYEECKAHTIVGLPGSVLYKLNDMPKEIMSLWERDIFRLIYANKQYVALQERLIRLLKEQGIDFVILKGTAASQYYARPELRQMGDIDIMPQREQFEKTCSILTDFGYSVIAYNPPYKCMVLKKNNIIIEVHRNFAKMNDIHKAEYLDRLIADNIQKDTFVLPDAVNGVVLLQHIDHHLENGIGLRQILDWQMFVNSYLSDENWNHEFCDLARAIGLEDLAKALTRMSQLYLGLRSDIRWCLSADSKICDQLLEYILSSGNFGRKIDRESKVVYRVLDVQNPLKYFQRMQSYGLIHLKQDNIIWPSQFAWLYQIIRFFRMIRNQDMSILDVLHLIKESSRRRRLLRKLNTYQDMKGIAVYKNGKFVKE